MRVTCMKSLFARMSAANSRVCAASQSLRGSRSTVLTRCVVWGVKEWIFTCTSSRGRPHQSGSSTKPPALRSCAEPAERRSGVSCESVASQSGATCAAAGFCFASTSTAPSTASRSASGRLDDGSGRGGGAAVETSPPLYFKSDCHHSHPAPRRTQPGARVLQSSYGGLCPVLRHGCSPARPFGSMKPTSPSWGRTRRIASSAGTIGSYAYAASRFMGSDVSSWKLAATNGRPGGVFA